MTSGRTDTNKIITGRSSAVTLSVQIFESEPGGLFQRWAPEGSVPSYSAVVGTESALAAALALYGARVAALVESLADTTWRIIARCLPTGTTVGEWTWVRSAETGRWVPAAEPWCVWDEMRRVEALDRATRRAAELGHAA